MDAIHVSVTNIEGRTARGNMPLDAPAIASRLTHRRFIRTINADRTAPAVLRTGRKCLRNHRPSFLIFSRIRIVALPEDRTAVDVPEMSRDELRRSMLRLEPSREGQAFQIGVSQGLVFHASLNFHRRIFQQRKLSEEGEATKKNGRNTSRNERGRRQSSRAKKERSEERARNARGYAEGRRQSARGSRSGRSRVCTYERTSMEHSM
ncbi:hypothetical protein BV25DRAFT_785843 [Artomyces pyxidatus]|uniref:Uncharacterized protein n=1 Tax=Artomyces pyxidatus TaxID=48021 RepID=A0ACB8T076_9AGAM|nr:hypothetical protein BV25DRAFT_785843 [Artomyces pyxidatus]